MHTTTPSTADERAAVPRRAWLITALIVAFMVLNFADKAVLGLAAGPIMRELGLSAGVYGAISSSFYLLFSLSGLVVGFVAARVSSRVLLCAITAAWAVVQLPVLLVAAVPTLLLNRVLLGAAEGPATAMSMHALYKWFPARRRGFPSALQVSGAALGTLVSAPLLTWVIGEFGWRAAFGLLAVLSAAWCAVWWLCGHDGPYTERRAEAAGQRVPLRGLLLNGTVLGGMAAAFGSHWALTLSSAWLPVYLNSQPGMTPGRTAAVISGIAGLSLVLLLGGSALVDALKARGVSSRWSGGFLQGAAVLLAGAAMLALPFAPELRLLLVALAFGAHALAIPLHYGTTAEVVPAGQRGPVFGVVAAAGTLPGLVAPFASGLLIDAGGPQAGYTAAFLAAGVVMLACGLAAVWLVRPERDAARVRR